MPGPDTRLGVAIQRQSTTDQVAAALREAILSGRILPGTPLREVALAGELGVSRNTVREAARILGSEGLIRHQMNRGATVAGITGQDVDDIYAARLALELAGAEALMSRRDPVVFHKLEGLAGQIEDAVRHRDVAAALQGDRLFHATIVAATGSPRLQRFYSQLQQEQRLALSLAERSSRELGRTADDHRELLDSLHGSKAQAKAQLRTHLRPAPPNCTSSGTSSTGAAQASSRMMASRPGRGWLGCHRGPLAPQRAHPGVPGSGSRPARPSVPRFPQAVGSTA